MVTRGTHYHPNHSHPDTHDAPLISGLPQGSSNDTYKHRRPDGFYNTSEWPTYVTRIWLSRSLTEVSKSYTLSQQPAMTHVPPPAELKDKVKWQQVTSHDHLPRSLSAARRVMMALPPPNVIITTQNISLPLKRESKLLMLYISTFTQRGG